MPDADEVVARGAAVQAAAVLTGCAFDDITDAWGHGPAATVDPDPSVDGASIRATYNNVIGAGSPPG